MSSVPTPFKFSVVVPSHHRPDRLKALLGALELQSLDKDQFEVVLILSPQDPSFSWLDKYSGPLNLKFLWPESDQWGGKNVSFKRNYGAEISQAPWLAFVDDDCMPTSEWLASALPHLENSELGGIEGKTITPENAPRTLTWKGMQRLSRPGGYQTCNIFYRRDLFLSLGGFDSENFPWFLEDTDFAWSVLDTGKEIAFEPKCLVEHPVGEPATWRLIHEAKGAGLKVRLFLKHPVQYEKSEMKALRWIHFVYLGLILASLVSLALGQLEVSGAMLTTLFLVLLAHMVKLFRGLRLSLSEVFGVAWRTAFWPLVALWSLVKEKNKSGMKLAQFLKLITP